MADRIYTWDVVMKCSSAREPFAQDDDDGWAGIVRHRGQGEIQQAAVEGSSCCVHWHIASDALGADWLALARSAPKPFLHVFLTISGERPTENALSDSDVCMVFLLDVTKKGADELLARSLHAEAHISGTLVYNLLTNKMLIDVFVQQQG